MAQDASYSFSTEPRAVASKRSAYREDEYRGEEKSGNLMYDRRIVRGNTHAAQVVDHQQAERMAASQASQSRKMRGRMNAMLPPGTPPPVDGRSHIDVQTENYLEELADKVPEVNEETQTEAFMDRPPSPIFMPTKVGLDAATQIEDGELFNFELEVEPILEVLVGKTLEQSMQEVLEEEELANIRAHQEEFEQQRNAELAEVQRLEAEEKRKEEEKKRRVTQAAKRAEEEAALHEKVSARAFAKEYLNDLHSNVFGKLMDAGHFYDPVSKEVADSFLPWLKGELTKKIEKRSAAEGATEALLAHAMERAAQKRKERQAALAAAEAAAAAKAKEEAEAAAAAAERDEAEAEE